MAKYNVRSKGSASKHNGSKNADGVRVAPVPHRKTVKALNVV